MLNIKQQRRTKRPRQYFAAAGALLALVVGASMLFLPRSAEAAWYGGGDTWAYRLGLTIASANVDANLTDFPVYVDLADLPDNFWQNTTSSCGDIRITTSDGTTEVPREIAACDTVSKTGELYFKASSLSSAVDNVFYIYYGNLAAGNYPDTDTYGAQNVWTNNFAAVWHLEELAGDSTMTDSTANANNGTYQNGASGGANSLVGSGDF